MMGILTDKEGHMTNIGLDRMEVRAVFRRNLVGKLEDASFIDDIADAVGQAIEENNRRLWETVQQALKKGE